MKTIFIPTLAFLVLASGLATADTCHDSKGKVVSCSTTVKGTKSNGSERLGSIRLGPLNKRVEKPATPSPAPTTKNSGHAEEHLREPAPVVAPTPAPVGVINNGSVKGNGDSQRVEKPATPAPVGAISLNSSRSNPAETPAPAPTPAPAGLAIDNGRNNPDSRVKQTAPTRPAPVVEKPPVKPTPPPKGGETGSTSSYRGEKPTTPLAPGTAESTTGNEAQKPAPTPSPAPVGATTINGSKSNNYREEKPTTPPASVIAPTPTPAPTTPVKPVKKKPHHGLLKVW
jgi:hypothetical protein